MLHAEWIEYLKRENKSKSFEQVKSYYMQRKLRRSIQIDNKLIDEESIDEKDIFEENDEKVLIISAEPGMGKSLILDNFTQNSTSDNFLVKIILNTCKTTLSGTNFKDNLKKDLIDFEITFE